MFNREELYRYLYNHCDQNNVIGMKQNEIAKEIGISYQRLSEVMKEFIDLGMIEKQRHKFIVLYEPDKIPWDRFKELRKRYIEVNPARANRPKVESSDDNLG